VPIVETGFSSLLVELELDQVEFPELRVLVQETLARFPLIKVFKLRVVEFQHDHPLFRIRNRG